MKPQTDRKTLRCSCRSDRGKDEEGKKKGSHVCTVSYILGEDFQGDGLGVVPVFSLKDPTEAEERCQTQNKNQKTKRGPHVQP